MVEVLSLTCERFVSYRDVTNHGLYNQSDCADDFNFTTSVQCKLMKSEKLRLETYRNWPSSCYQRPETLAKAGLFYTGVGDRVKCPFCLGVLKKWQSGDDPMSEHRHHFSYCKFVLGENVGNIPILHDAMVKRTHNSQKDSTDCKKIVDLVDYTMEETRLISFSNWPSDLTQTPDALAHAGFYHIPSEEKPDRVKCAYCHGKLYGWNLGDDPWFEHARCFPKCPYIKLCMDEKLIDDLLAHHESQKESRMMDEIEAFNDTTTIIETRAVKSVLDMGFPSNLVKQVTEMYNTENRDPSVEELVNTLLETVDEREKGNRGMINTTATVPTTAQCTVNTTPGRFPYTSINQSPHDYACGISEPAEMTSGHSGVRGNTTTFIHNFQNIDSHTVAKHVPDHVTHVLSHVRFIYMPCGHEACCGPCSVSVAECPNCHVKITGCVRAG